MRPVPRSIIEGGYCGRPAFGKMFESKSQRENPVEFILESQSKIFLKKIMLFVLQQVLLFIHIFLHMVFFSGVFPCFRFSSHQSQCYYCSYRNSNGQYKAQDVSQNSESFSEDGCLGRQLTQATMNAVFSPSIQPLSMMFSSGYLAIIFTSDLSLEA
jgi:hypothetical protein